MEDGGLWRKLHEAVADGRRMDALKAVTVVTGEKRSTVGNQKRGS